MKEGKETFLAVPLSQNDCILLKRTYEQVGTNTWYECINLGLEPTKEERLFKALQSLYNPPPNHDLLGGKN
jgi:hypothetical protein